MGDDHHAALEALQCDADGVAHVDVEMIGRFIQQEKIGAPRHQQRQCQARLLAAGKSAHRFERPIAFETESAQMIAHALFFTLGQIRSSQIAHMPKSIAIRQQLLHLLLREVADAQVRGGNPLARERRRTASQHLGQSRFAGTVRPQQGDAIQGPDRYVDVIDDARMCIAAGGVFHRQQGTRCFERSGKFELERTIDVRRYDALHALQHLEPALRLARLGGAGAEAIHKGGDFRHSPYLPRLQGALQRQFLGALLFELRVVAGVGMNGPIFDVQHPFDDGIEKLAIVRNHEQGARKCRQPIFQPDYGVQIEVIRGLIQQQ